MAAHLGGGPQRHGAFGHRYQRQGTEHARTGTDARGRNAREHRGLERQPRGKVGEEARGGRALHEPGHEIAVPAPQQLRHGTAHRVADRDHRTGIEIDERLRAVVRALREPEHASIPKAPTMAAQVRRDDAEVLRQRFEHLEPVEPPACNPTVQEENGRGTGGPREFADEGRAASRQLDASPVWDG